MSFSSFFQNFRGLVTASFGAGILLLGLSASGAQAATVTEYLDDLGGWQTQVAADGFALPGILEDFFDATLVSGFDITFGSSLPGSISGGEYDDRADSAAGQNPLLTFSGLGIMAFGADFNLGPNSPGTGLNVFITFVDDSTMELSDAILSAASNDGFVGFFGIVSDMAIRSILFLEADAQQFSSLYETFSMDNIRFVAAVPIPAALPLFLSALAALGFVGRRRKRLAAA